MRSKLTKANNENQFKSKNPLQQREKYKKETEKERLNLCMMSVKLNEFN